MPLDDYCPPQCFYHNYSILKLDLCWCTIKVAGQAAGWTALKRLCLSRVCIDDEQIAKVILGCPVLETQVWMKFNASLTLMLTPQSVKKLIIVKYPHGELELNAPCIGGLDIEGCAFGPTFRLIDSSSLECVAFDHAKLNRFDGDVMWHPGAVAIKILQSIHVKKLIFGPLFIQALSLVKLLGGPLPLFKCKHVTIRLSFLDHEVPGIACLLNNSPGLETLIINVMTPFKDSLENLFQTCNCETWDFNEDEYFSSMGGEKFLGLKNIEVSRHEKMCTGYSIQDNDEEWHEFKLVAYLLQTAHALEKLVITSMMDDYCKCSRNCGLQYVSHLTDKIIRNCLGASGAYELEFRKNKPYAKFSFNNFDVKSIKSLQVTGRLC